MDKFIKKYYRLTIIISVLVFVGCSSTDNSPNGELERASINKDNPVSLEYDKTAKDEKNEDDLYQPQKKEEKQLTLTDGSQYTEMKDAYGNKVEYRYFESGAPVKYISLETLSDGTTTVSIKNWDGTIKRVAPSLINDPWQKSAQEIASLAGIYSGSRSQAQLTNNQSVSSPLQSGAKTNNRIIKTSSAQALKPVGTTSNEIRGAIKPE